MLNPLFKLLVLEFFFFLFADKLSFVCLGRASSSFVAAQLAAQLLPEIERQDP